MWLQVTFHGEHQSFSAMQLMSMHPSKICDIAVNKLKTGVTDIAHHSSAVPQPFLPPNILPPLSQNYRPHRLESIAPRDTISLIIALFFDFVYPLTPSVHKPSFMADLHARREERDPLFFALVMSLVASTLVQVPRSYLPMERAVVRRLAQTCHEASRHITIASYDPPTSMHVVIRYLYVHSPVLF